MKFRAWRLAGFVLTLISFLVLWFLFREDTPLKKKAAKDLYYTVSNQLVKHTVFLDGRLVSAQQVVVNFPMSGILEQGIRYFGLNDYFHKGEILYQLNNETAFQELSQKKKAFATSIKSLIPAIDSAFMSEHRKWEVYSLSIRSDDLLPVLPPFKNRAEFAFFESKSIVTQYNEVAWLEEKLRAYYYAAPFNGIVADVYYKPGNNVPKGKAVALLTNSALLEIRAKIKAEDNYLLYKSPVIDFLDTVSNFNKLIVKAQYNRTEPVKGDSSFVYCYFSIKSKNQTTVKIATIVKSTFVKYGPEAFCVLPKKAVKNSSVRLLVNKQVKTQAVEIMQSKGDSLYVSGLNNGDLVILRK